MELLTFKYPQPPTNGSWHFVKSRKPCSGSETNHRAQAVPVRFTSVRKAS